MIPLPIDVQRRLDAAEGWLELGDALSASAELATLAPQERQHPLILALGARIYTAAGLFAAGLNLGIYALNGRAVDAELLVALARCNCALDRPRDAKICLALAFHLNPTQEFRLRMLDDQALGAVWYAA